MAAFARPVNPSNDSQRGGAPGSDVTALLHRGSSFEGKLAFEGTVQINGDFTGDVRSADTLVIGEGGRVHGEIDVGTLIVHGNFEGKVRARQLVEMHAPARVRGSILTPALVIDRGVVFEGTTRMEDLDAVVMTPTPKAVKAG